MKKFLLVVALVLCMALPAAAATFIADANTTSEDLRAAVASADVDTIVISADITLPAVSQGGNRYGLYISSGKRLTLQINKGCELKVSCSTKGPFYGISNSGTLTVKGAGSLNAHHSGTNACHGIYVSSGGTMNIDGGVSISASATGNGIPVYGVNVSSGGTVNIDGGVSIRATSVGQVYGVNVSSGGTMNIDGGVSISASTTATDDRDVRGINVSAGGTANIDGGVSISASASGDSDAYGVYSSGTVNIDGGVSISATGVDEVYGVCVKYGGTANILSADVSTSGGSTQSSVYKNSGTLIVYAGTFNDDAASADEYLGPDSSCEKISDDKYVVINSAKITLTPSSLDVTQGTAKTQTVSVDFCASGDKPLSIDKLEVTPASVDGITATSSGGTITFDVDKTCKVGTYTFSVFCKGDDSNGTHLQTETFTVTVKESTLTVNPTSADVLRGSSAAFTADMKINNESVDIANIAAAGLPDGMTCTLNGNTVTITTTDACAVGSYPLTLTATDNNGHTAEAKITVNVTEKSDPEPTPTSSASNGGCNAGFAGLALAAFALLAAKRKK